MKKFFYLMALLAITPFALTSCSSDDDDDNSQTPSDTSVTLQTPQYKEKAMKLTTTSQTAEVPLNGENVILHAIELTESGNYLLTYEKKINATRATGLLEYLMGLFTVNADGSIMLKNFGTLVLSITGGSSYEVKLIPTGQAGLEGIQIEMTKLAPVAPSQLTNYLCRTWTIENTRLRGTIEGASVARDFAGKCNVNELVAYAKERGAKITDEPKPNTVVDGVNFTAAGTYFLNYANGTYDVGTWQWTNQLEGTGSLTYKWESESMGTSLESGKASVAFTGSKCKLTLPANVTGSTIEVVYTMY